MIKEIELIKQLAQNNLYSEKWDKIRASFLELENKNEKFFEILRKDKEAIILYARSCKEKGDILHGVDFLINKIKIQDLKEIEIDVELAKTIAYLLRDYYKLKTNPSRSEENDNSDEEPNLSNKNEDKNSRYFVDKNILNVFAFKIAKILEPYKESDKKLYYSFIFKMLKYESKTGEPNWKFIEEVINEMDPYEIDEEPHKLYIQLSNGQKKMIESASDLENYYSIKSKALMGQEKYDEALYTCLEAFSRIKTFHLYNDVWLKRKMTSIYIRKNEYEKAYKLFSEIFSKRKDWFLIKDLGDMYFQKKEYDQAMYYYICAALAKGNILNKIQLYHKLGETLEILGFDGEDHFQLAYKIRKKMDWEPELIENKLKNINDQRTIEEVNIELKSFWLRHLEHGEIVKLFKNNLYGFIKSQDKEYIFKFIFLNLHPDKLKLNAKVKFAKLPSYDFKTKKFTFEAFYIELI